MDKQESELLELLSEVLDKYISSQHSNTMSINSMDSSIKSLHNSTANDLKILIEKVSFIYDKNHDHDHTVSGLISEAVDQINAKQEIFQSSLTSIGNEVVSIKKVLYRPSYWIKLVAGIVISIGSITTAVMAIANYKNSPETVHSDLDSDGDNILNSIDANPNDPDSNKNGIIDGKEVTQPGGVRK